MSWRAERANSKGIELEEKGWTSEAEAAYRKAATLDPEWSVPWFNLGLLAKRQRRWSESAEWNRHAAALDSSDEGAWWNLGIAATALGDWSTARFAWRGCGLAIPEGEGPLKLDMGLVPIRIAAAGEVVWCRRIDPARAIVRSVPLPECDRAFGDLLLHDGAPNGWRWLNAQEVPVFDELDLLQPSSYRTFACRALVTSPKNVILLADIAHELGLAVEDWSSLGFICEDCSKGNPHEHHLHEAPEWKPDRHIGIAALGRAAVDTLLARWRESAPVDVSEPELVFERG